MLVSMSTLETILEANIDRDIPTMVWGPAGVGKSSLPKQIAAKRRKAKPKEGWKLIDFRATLRDPVAIMGLPWIDQKNELARWYPPSELPNEQRDGQRGILLMDELPQAADMVQKACFSLVLDRYVGEYKLPKGWVIIAAGNRVQDRSGANRMNKALANRFAHYEVAAELDSFCKWCASVDLNPLIPAFVRFRPELLHMMPDNDENTFPTPRAWESVAKHAGEKDEVLRHALVAGLVGEDPAAQFESFVRIWARLPSMQKILTDPMGAALPNADEMSLMYAVTTALARHVDRKNFANALKYIQRLPTKEYEVAFMHDVVTIDKDLKETKTFGDWFANNSEVII